MPSLEKKLYTECTKKTKKMKMLAEKLAHTLAQLHFRYVIYSSAKRRFIAFIFCAWEPCKLILSDIKSVIFKSVIIKNYQNIDIFRKMNSHMLLL